MKVSVPKHWTVPARKLYRQTPKHQPGVEDLIFPGDRIVVHHYWNNNHWTSAGIVRSLRSYQLVIDGIPLYCTDLSFYDDNPGSIKSLGYSVCNELVAVDGRVLKLFASNPDWVEVFPTTTSGKQLQLF
ncbi:MAG: hypothetical protein AB1589_36270 [Cyanobacteriota bacterium]